MARKDLTIYDAARNLILRSELHGFGLDDNGASLQTGRSVQEIKYDKQQRPSESFTVIEDLVANTTTKTRVGFEYSQDERTSIRREDEGVDGKVELEVTERSDAQGRTLETVADVPGQPIATRALHIFDASGKLIREESFEDGDATPTLVRKYKYL